MTHRAIPAHCRVQLGKGEGVDLKETTIGPECFFHDAKQEREMGLTVHE